MDVCPVCRSAEGDTVNHSDHYVACACVSTRFHAHCWDAYRGSNTRCVTCRSPTRLPEEPAQQPPRALTMREYVMCIFVVTYAVTMLIMILGGLMKSLEIGVVIVCIWASAPIFAYVALGVLVDICVRERLFLAQRTHSIFAVYAFVVHMVCFSSDVCMQTVREPLYRVVNGALNAHFLLLCAVAAAGMCYAAALQCRACIETRH